MAALAVLFSISTMACLWKGCIVLFRGELLSKTGMQPEQKKAEEATISGRGEMAERVRAFDWARTPLGPPQQWPQSLRVAVGICLNSRFPMFVWWGPQLINIYNDSYIPMLGKRHPAALGRAAQPAWAE